MDLYNTLSSLRGIVQCSRVSGFTLQYSEMLLCAMFADGNNKPNYIVPEKRPWPVFRTPKVPSSPGGYPWTPLPEGPSVFSTPRTSYSPGEYPWASLPDQSPTSRFSELPYPSQFDLKLNKSPSFAQELTQDTLKHEASVSPACTTAPGKETLVNYNRSRTPRNRAPTASHVSRFQNRMPSISETGPSLDEESVFQKSVKENPMPRTRFGDSGLSRTVTHERNITPPPRKDARCSTPPKSPNTMNRLNEQDPAFRRTLDALHSVDKQSRDPSKIAGPDSVTSSHKLSKEAKAADRCQTSSEERPKFDNPSRKYSSFFSRLKGGGASN